MSHHGRAFINGEWVSGQSVGQNTNPADQSEILGTYVKLTASETTAAIDSAQRAAPEWGRMPPPQRARILAKAAVLMDARRHELAEILTREEGKILSESLGEVQKAINVLEFTAGEGRRFGGDTLPSEMPNTLAYTLRQPLGVVGIVTPWNFPVAIPVWKMAPALLCGNAIVFKPASLTPWSAEVVTRVFADAGLPPGVLNLVTGSGSEVGNTLAHDPRIRAISFTGSNEVGLQLYQQAAKRGARVQCEMGGKNPLVVLDDADVELAAIATAQGAFGSTGQRCTATSRAIVMHQVADRFVELVLQHAAKVVCGAGMDSKTTMGPCVDQAQMQTVLDYIKVGVDEGAVLKWGGHRLTQGALERGFFVTPTVFDHVKRHMRVAQEEIFGPVLSVLRVSDVDEALDVANDVAYGLSSSIYSRDVNRIQHFVERIATGITHVNSPTMGGEVQVPFGGIKATSVGYREMGRSAIDFYSDIKSVYVDYTGKARDTKIY